MQTVILHGGGTTAPETTKRLIECAGGPMARIVVLAHTGEDVAGKAKRSADWLRENGAKDVQAPVWRCACATRKQLGARVRARR